MTSLRRSATIPQPPREIRMSDTATLSRLFASIEPELERVDRMFEERAFSGLEMLNTAAEHALSSPGKRLRTALTLLSGKLIDYRIEKLLPLSVAFEMVHLASLLHDDIIDHAATRRGIPTVNARYGDHIAILLGDFFFARTAGLIADIEDFRIDRLFSETVASVCEGSIVELLSERTFDLSLSAYLDRVTRKTAVLMAACCKGGTTVGGGSDAQIALMEDYGRNLGVAFQIMDDVLDYSGTAASIGKPAGNDFRQGLITLPLIFAVERDGNGRAAWVEEVLRSESPSDQQVGEVVAWVKAGPALTEARELAQRYGMRAHALLSEFPSSPERDVLEELVDFVMARTR
jgi:geranylgeranyl pyrophosphate synthase